MMNQHQAWIRHKMRENRQSLVLMTETQGNIPSKQLCSDGEQTKGKQNGGKIVIVEQNKYLPGVWG